jgi:hypothetical protein
MASKSKKSDDCANACNGSQKDKDTAKSLDESVSLYKECGAKYQKDTSDEFLYHLGGIQSEIQWIEEHSQIGISCCLGLYESRLPILVKALARIKWQLQRVGYYLVDGDTYASRLNNDVPKDADFQRLEMEGYGPY